MSKAFNLSQHLADWLKLTEAETDAIQSSQWNKLASIQAKKAEFRHAVSAPLEGIHSNTELSAQLGRLISLEARNLELLSIQQRRAQQQRERLEKTNRDIHRLHLSYAQPPKAGWTSYS